MPRSAEKPRVVVVGGQFAGRRASRLLRRGGEFDVTLVDAKGFWEYTPGVLRCLVEPAAAQRMVLPQPRGTVRATVVGLETSEGGKSATGVKLNDGSTLPADHVVLATGSTYTDPVKAAHDIASTPEGRREQIRAAHATLASAAGVVIVGGGTVGVELAAEIAGTWGRHKVVTIVTPGDRLLERMPPRAGRLAQRWLEQKGVWVILNDRIEDWDGAPRDSAIPRPDGGEWCLRTEQGRELRASLVYPCVGGQPSAPLDANRRDPRGAINVDAGLRVEGFDNVYGAGDCASTKEEKNAFSADLNATAVVQNIRARRAGRPARGYPRSVCGSDSVPRIAVVSLHKWNAVMQFNGLVLGGAFPAFVKWFIEAMQISSAAGVLGATALWDAVEALNVFLAARVPFL